MSIDNLDHDPSETIEPQAPESAAPETPKEPAKEQDASSRKDAIRKAIEKHGDGRPKDITDASPKASKQVEEQTVRSASQVEAPQEFSAAGKEAWKKGDVAGIQQEYRRIHDLRTKELSRAQNEAKRAREEAAKETQTWRDFAQKVKPYIEARGQEGVSPESAIIEAMNLVQAFKSSDPATAKAELKKIGIDLDAPAKGAAAQAALPPELEQKINSLQEYVEGAKKQIETQKFQQLSGVFNSVFEKMGKEKGRTGESVYLDLNDNSDEGIALAKRLGSFALNPEFQAGVLRRFPGADFERVCREAYLTAGGRVSGDAVKVSQNNQQHLDKSRRAAAITPGRMAATNSRATVGTLSRKEAIRRAMEEDRQH